MSKCLISLHTTDTSLLIDPHLAIQVCSGDPYPSVDTGQLTILYVCHQPVKPVCSVPKKLVYCYITHFMMKLQSHIYPQFIHPFLGLL